MISEFQFSLYTPSMVAAASLAAAVQGLLPSRREAVMSGIFSQLHHITAVETVSTVETLLPEPRLAKPLEQPSS